MKVIFMGTPDFGIPVLKSIVEAGHDVCTVVTQPDKPKGRGKGVAMSPVKEEAIRLGIPVFQPDKIKKPEAVCYLRDLAPDVIVVVAFGQILSQEVLDIPRFGCVNVHASLLPRLRGAAPIQQAILDGDKVTGITTMLMDKGLDTGDILLQQEVDISDDETGGSLFDKLSIIGAGLLVKTLAGLEEGSIVPVPQTGESTYAGMFDKAMGLIDWKCEPEEIERKIRAMDPWPSAYTYLEGRLLKLWKAEVVDHEELAEASDTAAVTVSDTASDTAADIDSNMVSDTAVSGGCSDVMPGTVVSVSDKGIDIAAGSGIIRILELQPEGKKRMESAAYLRGHSILTGTVLGLI